MFNIESECAKYDADMILHERGNIESSTRVTVRMKPNSVDQSKSLTMIKGLVVTEALMCDIQPVTSDTEANADTRCFDFSVKIRKREQEIES